MSMGLVHRAAQVGVDTVALECHECHARYVGTEMEAILDMGTDCDLRCLEPDCGAGGMIAHKASRISERFPYALAAFTPIPEALMTRPGGSRTRRGRTARRDRPRTASPADG